MKITISNLKRLIAEAIGSHPKAPGHPDNCDCTLCGEYNPERGLEPSLAASQRKCPNCHERDVVNLGQSDDGLRITLPMSQLRLRLERLNKLGRQMT